MVKFILILLLLLPLTATAQISYDIRDTTLSSEELNLWRPDSTESYINIPPIYYKWWEEISICAKRHNDIKKIKWWRVIETSNDTLLGKFKAFHCPIVTWCDGWSNNVVIKPNIFIAYDRIYEQKLIKHEMLHVLLGDDNTTSPIHHPLFRQCKVTA